MVDSRNLFDFIVSKCLASKDYSEINIWSIMCDTGEILKKPSDGNLKSFCAKLTQYDKTLENGEMKEDPQDIFMEED